MLRTLGYVEPWGHRALKCDLSFSSEFEGLLMSQSELPALDRTGCDTLKTAGLKKKDKQLSKALAEVLTWRSNDGYHGNCEVGGGGSAPLCAVVLLSPLINI